MIGKNLEWRLDRFGHFNKKDTKGHQFRLNFQDDKILKLEKKVVLTEQEKKESPLKNTKWVVDKSQSYDKVVVSDKNELVFEQKINKENEVKKGD